MRDHKINVLQGGSGGKSSKTNKARGKNFGFQILGFGSGGVSLAPNPFTADYLMVAGGGSGRGAIGGGGGAGGLLFSYCNSCAAGLALDSGVYDITIGGGGTAGLGTDTTILKQRLEEDMDLVDLLEQLHLEVLDQVEDTKEPEVLETLLQ